MQFQNPVFADFAKMPKCQKIGIGVAKMPKSDKNPVFRQKNDQKTGQKHDITRAKTSILYVRCGRNYRKIHCLEGPPPPPKTPFLSKSANPRTRKTPTRFRRTPISDETVARHIMNQSSRSSPRSTRINTDVQHRLIILYITLIISF